MRKFEIISKEQFVKNVNAEYYENIKLPQRTTKNSAGYDFYLPYDVVIPKKGRVLIHTGIKACMNSDEFLMVVIRSSLGVKKGLRMSNQVGIIDSDYYNNIDNEGEILVAIENNQESDVKLKADERVAQGIFMKYLVTDDEKEIKKIRLGGIGSTN